MNSHATDYGANRQRRDAISPKLEFRIPISPRASNLRMVRYFLESVRESAGPLAKSAHTVLSVGADESPRDLRAEFPWMDDYSIEVRWVDRAVFRRWSYYGTGFDRFWVASDADVVAMIDADLLVAGDFDNIIVDAFHSQRMLGVIAFVSPFGFEEFAGESSEKIWEEMFRKAGLPPPQFDFQYSGWGLDFSQLMPNRKVRRIISNHPHHRRCPPYFNYGVVVGPRHYFDLMGKTFAEDFELVRRVRDTIYNSQVTNCITFARHDIPCGVIPINYNFPMNLPCEAIRSVNPDPDGEDDPEDIRIFHYIGRRKFFETEDTVRELVNLRGLDGAWPTFQRTLCTVQERIADSPSS